MTPAFGPFPNPSRTPDPSLAALHADEQGHLWSFAWVAARNWQDAWTDELIERWRRVAAREGPSELSAEYQWYPPSWKLLETMIEVLDPDRGTVLARRLMEGQVIGVLEDGRVAVYYETEIGVPHVNILSVTLSGGR